MAQFMKINVFQFLRSIYVFLDLVEKELFGIATNRGARVIYVSLKTGQRLHLNDYEVLDLLFLSLLQDSGMSAEDIIEMYQISLLTGEIKGAQSKEHCIRGEINLQDFPFFSGVNNAILYHHEHYDGSGVFGLKDEAIPLMSQIIYFASNIDYEYNFDLAAKDLVLRKSIESYVNFNQGKLFSPKITDAYLDLSNDEAFWKVFLNHDISNVIKKETAQFNFEFDYDKIRNMTNIFSKIVDTKSPYTSKHSASLAYNMDQMVKYYHFNQEHRVKLLIASDLHDIGKLGVNPTILEKNGSLTKEEFDVIKHHPLVGYKSINQIEGLKDVAKWILNHHEKCDGSGYPRGLYNKDLDFESKLLGCLDIYTALMEDRPYRPAMSQDKAFSILFEMANNNQIDKSICEDIKQVFNHSKDKHK